MSPAQRLRTLLTLILIGSNVLVLVLSAQSIKQSRQQYELATETLTRNVANALDQNLSGSIERIDLALRTVIDELEHQLLTRGSLDSALMTQFTTRHEQRLPELEAFRIADHDGLVVLGKGVKQEEKVSWADRDYFIYHKSTSNGGLHVAKPRMGRVAKQYIIGFSRRYNYPDGRFAGVVSAPIAVSHFTEIIQKFDVGPHGTIVIRDANVGLITRTPAIPDKPAGQIGNNAVSPELQEIIHSGVTTASYYTPTSADGYQRIVDFRRLSKAPIMFIVGAASKDYLAGWHAEVIKTALPAGAFMLLSLILGGLLLQHMRRAEERENTLAASESRLKAIIENEPECIKIVDKNGALLKMNPAGLAMIEADDFQQVDRQAVINLIAPGSRDTFENLHQRVLAGETVETEFELIGLKGSNRWVETHAVPLLDHGEIVHLAITRDITARKEAEAELREHREHLEKLVENRTVALSLAKEIAEAANRAKSTFLANMSHELRTPMNAIMGMTELVLRNTEDDKQKDQLGKVMQASKHLLAVINDILDISKIEAEHLPLEKTTFNIGSLLENLASIVSQKIQEKGLQLHIEATPEICRQPLLGDPLRLGQVLLNLCTNAIKFTEHGSISVQATISEWSSTDCLIRLQVSDTGLGISEEDQTRIFLAFEQADASTTRQFGGTGLGLAISKRLVQLMGGTIGVTSAPGAGSTFWFTARLPLAAETALAPISTAESSAEEQLLQHYSGRRILLAEDEPINREVSVSLLEECGLLVDIAEDGLQATELARDNAYALILMDMQMPKMGGLEATELIRRQARHEKTPIIAMTANAFEEDRQHCFAAGMNDHIGKPVTPEKLFTTLLKWLGKTDQ